MLSQENGPATSSSAAAPGVQGCDDETALVAAVKPWLLRHGELLL